MNRTCVTRWLILSLLVFACRPLTASEVFIFPAAAILRGPSVPSIPPGPGGATALASSVESGSFAAAYAVDGDMATRWGSQYSDPQWITVDLKTPRLINQVTLEWEGAYGKSYKIQTSLDGQNWTDAYTATGGDGGRDVLNFRAVSAQFVRMYGTERGTQWGYSLKEIKASSVQNNPPPAPSGLWTQAGYYGGGCYPDVVFDPNNANRAYLLSDVAGIWKSDDNGDNWRFITTGLNHLIVPGLAVAPSDSNVLYAATQGGVYRSQNAGGSWTLTNNMSGEITFIRPENHATVAVSHANSAVLAVGTSRGAVFYSSDSGSTWSTLANNKTPFGNTNPITSLKMARDGSALYAASNNGGIARYTFSNSAWTLLRNGGGPTASQDVFISQDGQTLYAPGGGVLYASKDGGNTWIRSAAVPRGTITRVSEAADGSYIAAVWEQGWNGGVVRSLDKGATWMSSDAAMIPDTYLDPTRIWARSAGARVVSIKISPFNKNVILRTDWWGVWRSDDGGLTWREKLKGAPNSVGSQIVVTPGNNIYIATMDNGLVASYDQGAGYKALFPLTYNDSTAGHVWRVAVSGDEKRIVGTSSPWNQNINQIIVSEDGGKNFTVVRQGLPAVRPRVNTMWGEGYPRAIAADPANFNRIYLGIDGDDGGGLFISNDGGKSWARSAGQPGARRIYNGLVVDPTNPNRIYWAACGAGGGVYRSDDAGASWKYVFTEMSWVFDMAIGSDGTVYAAGDYSGSPRVYVSRDNGNTWSLLKAFTGRGAGVGISVDPKDPNRIAVSGHQWANLAGGRVYLSVDGGKNWSDLIEMPSGTGMAGTAFSPDGYLYGVRYAGSAFKRKI